MKIVKGWEAFNFCRDHNLILNLDQRVLYNHYLQRLPNLQTTSLDEALDFIEANFAEVVPLTWESCLPAGRWNDSGFPSFEETAAALIRRFSPDIFTLLLETDEIAKDERAILKCCAGMGDEAAGCSLFSVRELADRLRDEDYRFPPAPQPLIRFEEHETDPSFEQVRDHEPWLYWTCLRLVEQGQLKTLAQDPYHPERNFQEEAAGKFLFVPAHLFDFILHDAEEASAPH